jgi:8-oxo-dGTP diphosphatase
MGALRVVAAALIRDGLLLAARRPPGKRHGGRWELPGGKVEYTETEVEALIRELDEELGVKVDVGDMIGESIHSDPWGSIHLRVFRCTLAEGEPEAREHTELRWLTRRDIWSIQWAAADVPLLEKLVELI